MTVLGDGRVLLATGFNGTAEVATAQIYDPAANTWIATGSLATARQQAKGVLLQDGRVLVTGGQAGTLLNAAEVWDPSTGTWSSAGTMASPRSFHSMTLLADGRVLIAGGSNGLASLASAEIWDPATRSFTATGSLATARDSHSVTLLPDGRVLVVGGGNTVYLSSAEIWDPATGAWSGAGALTAPRLLHSATLLPGSPNRVLLAGGQNGGGLVGTAEIWSPPALAAAVIVPCRPALGVPPQNFPADPWPSGTTIRGFGARLTGCSEGSYGGNPGHSPANFPLVRFVSLSTGSLWDASYTQSRFWKADEVTFTVPGAAGIPPGYYAMQAVVNGIPSLARTVRISQANANYYFHRESALGGATRDLDPVSPAGHGAIQTPVLCESFSPVGPLLVESVGCGGATKTGQHVYPPAAGGFPAARSISGPWSLAADVKRSPGGPAGGEAYLFARIKRHGDGSLIHETARITTLNLTSLGTTAYLEAAVRTVIHPRLGDGPGCPSATVPCASTTLGPGDRVRVEWWIDVINANSSRSVELALESPGSTSADFPVLVTETLEPALPTLVHVRDLAAERMAAGVVLSWVLEGSADVTQMWIVRADGTPVGEPLLPPAELVTQAAFERLDPLAPEDAEYRLWVRLASGELETYGPVRPEDATASEGEARGCRVSTQVKMSLTPILLLAAVAGVVVARRGRSRFWRAARSAAFLPFAFLAGCAGPAGSSRLPAPGESIAIEVSASGWVRLPVETLIAGGLDPEIDPRTLGLHRRGVPVAIRFAREFHGRLAEAGSLEFWAEPSDSWYTDTAVYWLEPSVHRARFGEAPSPLAPPATAGPRRRHREAPDLFYAITARNGPASNFFWGGALALSAPASKDFELGVVAPSSAGTFRLQAELYGLSSAEFIEPDHHVQILLNGQFLGESWFDGEGAITMDLAGPASWIVPGANQVTLHLPHDLGAPRDTVLVSALTLDHPRLANTDDPQAPLVLDVDSSGQYVIGGLFSDTEVFDLTVPEGPTRLVPPWSRSVESELTFSVALAGSASRRLVLVPPGSSTVPAIARGRRADPRGDSEGADLLIVAPDSLLAEATRLAKHRSELGTPARVVVWESVIDAFGEGFPEPSAIAALVEHAREQWSPPPRFLLLLGDASYDARGRLSAEPHGNLLPTFFDDTSFFESPSDNPFVAASARAHPDLAVGRLPAADAEEAAAMIDKIIAYDLAPPASPGSSDSRVLLVADDAPSAWEWQLFVQTSESIAGVLPPSRTPTRVYVGDLGGPAARTRLLDELILGAGWVNYLGHGSYTVWATEAIFEGDDVETLPESDRLPVYVVMNCLTGYYAQPNWNLRSLGERLLITPRRGAVAVIGSAAPIYPGGQAELDQAMVQELLIDGEATLGEAFERAKRTLDPTLVDHGDVIASFHLLGDPSMRLRAP